MTVTVPSWAVVGVLWLALFGAWFTATRGWRWAWDGIWRLVYWLRWDRVTPLLEDGTWRACACCGIYPAREFEITCEDCAGWEDRALDHEAIDHRPDLPELPSEQSAEALGFGVERERRAPPWEAFQRIQYEAMGFEFPSGLMARVRELTP